LFLKTYRHLYEGEKRVQAARLEALVRSSLDKEGTSSTAEDEKPRNGADTKVGAPGIEPGTSRV
ncbi:MAG: hypothetical protein QOE36_2529, partial [Gaiellaceae bacterium]|nr:hypothetical protein [Gaiellaceae bacterium]